MIELTDGVITHLQDALRVDALNIADETKRLRVLSTVSGLQLSVDDVIRIQQVFHSEMELGIRERPSSLQMENTYIPELPDGTEEGRFLALDLGGTQFRVILMELSAGHVEKEVVKHYQVGEKLRVGRGEELFDFLAECIAHFVEEQGLSGVTLPLGFTFSFPMTQKALDVGNLVTWTKTFNCKDVIGHDAVKLLRAALTRRGDTHVEVLAILNDTTGTLVQGATLDPRTAIGLILGTGSNACYMEKADRVQHWEGQRHGEKEVIVDIEWGALGDNGVLDFIKTEFDRQVDASSIIVNSFTFEKYISGKYLGEVVRQVLVTLATQEVLLAEGTLGCLAQHGAFTTSFVSSVELDSVEGGDSNTHKILRDLGVSFSADDTSIVKHVCALVTKRAALLVAICVATLIQRMDREDTTVAVDGSLYKHHPRLRLLLDKYIAMLIPDKKYQLLLAEDGSGKGAGIVAAIAMKLRKRFKET